VFRSVAHLAQIQTLKRRYACFHISCLERIRLGIARKLQIINQTIIELRKSFFESGGNALERESLL
jgi:hypothetical protein